MELVSKADIGNDIGRSIAASIDTSDPWQLPKTHGDAQILEVVKAQTAYGILSHRWLQKELIFRDLLKMTAKLGTDTMHELGRKVDMGGGLLDWDNKMEPNLSLVKLIKFCQVAYRHGCKYVWFDTGCINKESSAELEESIRSMFSWYRDSAICIVHLNETSDAFKMSKDPWFTRGWTLQELLAPKLVKFYDQSWHPLTSAPNDRISDVELGVPLWETISNITTIPTQDLLSFQPGLHNIRDRMVWASKRETTRIEDMAYCLIGIFNIALSIAYGEGEMAFYRLQLKLMQHSDDKALFVWQELPSPDNSMFAVGPECFSRINYGFLSTDAGELSRDADTTHVLTNRGLRILLSVYEVEEILPGSVGTKYNLQVAELGKISVMTLRKETQVTQLKVAILGDILPPVYPPTSVAILLDLLPRNTVKHRRIPTRGIFKVDRPVDLKPPEKILIV